MKSRQNSSALQAATRRRWKRLPPEERLVFVDIELVAVGRRRAILQIAAVAISRSLVELESFEAKIRLDESRIVSDQSVPKSTFRPRLSGGRRDAVPKRLPVILHDS